MNRVRYPNYPHYWVVIRNVATACYGLTFVLGLLTMTDGKHSTVLNHPIGEMVMGLSMAGIGASILFGRYVPEIDGDPDAPDDRRPVPRFGGLIFIIVGAGFVYIGVRDLV